MTRLMILFIALLLSACATSSSHKMSEPISIDTGLIIGSGSDIHSYKGIPFAKAPIGDLRWKPPAPPEPWAGIREARSYGADCWQPAEYPELQGNGMSEDCLTLNVWTPAKESGERLPVYVWLYGGGWRYGSASHPAFDGENMARRGVIVVTLNYRMGLLGFLSHPQLSKESPTGTSGNYGLMDQIAALQWVQRNISAFGGDPHRVTLGGQSAGAMSVTTLMATASARGLFHQAIIQSDVLMYGKPTLKEAERFGSSLAADIATLRAMDGAQLVSLLKSIERDNSINKPVAGSGAIVDGSLVTKDDYEAFLSGAVTKIPMIIGSNANEGGGDASGHKVKTASEYKAYLRRNFGNLTHRAEEAFPVKTDADVLKALSDLYSEAQYGYGVREMLLHYTAYEPFVYRYRFTLDRNGSSTRPIHGAELQYPFENLSALQRGSARPFNETDINVSRSMSAAWARFIQTGNPNGGELPNWPTYSEGREQLMEFGRQIHVGEFQPTPGFSVIKDYYQQKRTERR